MIKFKITIIIFDRYMWFAAHMTRMKKNSTVDLNFNESLKWLNLKLQSLFSIDRYDC